MKKIPLGQNSNGTQTVVHVDDDELIATDVQNVEPIIELNKRLKIEGMRNKSAHGRLVASIPVTIWHEWRKDWQINFSDKWSWSTYKAMKLNSRDYSHLRTQEGKV